MSSVQVDATRIGFTTSDITEGTNLFYSDARVRANRLDQMAIPTSDINLNGVKITNLGSPTSSTDMATKGYVDSVAQGLSPKASARVATTTALPSNTYVNGVLGVGATLTAVGVGSLVIDGITVAVNDRVLVKDEASQLKNGIYTVTIAGSGIAAYVLTRATDSNTPSEIIGSFIFIESGTVNGDLGFVNTNTTAPTIGTDSITYTQFSGAGEITAGTGLSKNGNTLSLATSGVSAGTYTKITVDIYGRTTTGASATTTDISEGTNLYYTDARVRLNRLDQMASPIADVSMNSHKLTNVLDPTSAQDAATKNYVDTNITSNIPVTQIGELTMTGNATTTTIGTAGTYVKASGTTVAGTLVNFTHASNRLTYTGATTKNFKILITAGIQPTATAPRLIALRIAKNGTTILATECRAETNNSNNVPYHYASQGIVSLATNDFIEAWITNESGTQSLLVSELQITITSL